MHSFRTSIVLAPVLALFAFACSSGETGGGVGSGGSTTTSTATTATSTTGTGGSGGSSTCPAPTVGQLSFNAVYTTTYDSTNEQFSASFGDPNTSTLSASLGAGTLSILAKNSVWDVEIDVHLEPNVSFPITLTPSSYPNYVSGAVFSKGAGLANTFANGDNFVVTLQSAGCRVKGSFSGGMSSEDGGLELLSVGPGSFDVPLTAP
jgi:hypothetical protein